MFYHIEIWGCQMNEHDAEILSGMLEQIGYRKTEVLSQADVIILYTCCVREKAEHKVFARLGQLKKYKTTNPNLLIAVGGCMAQQPEMGEDIRVRAPYVDLVFGTHNIHRLPQLLEEAKDAEVTLIEVWDREREIVENLPASRMNKLKAYVTIMYGCNNFCSYCIVPYVRGRERSREPEEIIKELKELASNGFKEIMFLGQNVNSYGKDLARPVDFADLLLQADAIPGLERIRYMTSHPRDFTEKLINTIAGSQKICEHFHLPIQAGSNRILKLMRRGYTKESYLELIAKVREAVPQATLTTDIIVGFPGETDEDFADTLEVITKARFDQAYTFIYSPRKGTPAAEMPDQVPQEVKKERFQKLLDLQNRISWELNQQMLGKIEEVLVEGTSKTDPAKLSGRTRGNKIVVVDGPEELIGHVIKVKIEEAQTWSLQGKIIGE
ncbi:tRNA (N6-isopentenyl adenosine(37)-C2)-methylthiotransferase MiaB [Zhaonella formicivorans]|uniref:tRNA (N6-isopentenyl adenosine(37)-C2)-methylthiotransferase MiaB n=1 Tax=Zhaonella formicivorans TaxID=2528593 RepID=UPI0010E26D9A|nr:tRNA (N6-isopentenyl adenosine(37)-C2)-methylthiotransferase MiaB [Zhaonella formicivorans]